MCCKKKSGSNASMKSSMIVPVWVSHEKTPEKEILTYALLDTQSDTSFILDDTKDTQVNTKRYCTFLLIIMSLPLFPLYFLHVT